MGQARSARRTPQFPFVPMSREPHFWHLHLFLQECVFSGEQPLNRLTKLPADLQQNFRPDFLFVSLHGGEVPLANANPTRLQIYEPLRFLTEQVVLCSLINWNLTCAGYRDSAVDLRHN
jgi:hypothetical protein